MILTGPEIQKQISSGRICFEPFDAAMLNPNSVNYRLGPLLTVLQSPLDAHQPAQAQSIEIPKQGYLLQPGQVYLAHTQEKIGSDFFVMSLIGRSTLGRLGLWLQISADMGHLGTNNHWTLELRCVQPLMVFAGMSIGQVTFWQPQGDKTLYHGKYQGPNKAKPSDIHLESA